MSVHLSAASCIDWVARLTGAAGAAELFARAEAAGPAARPELVLPYLSGERTLHNDALVRGAFPRLDNKTDAGKLAQAVLEGVAFASTSSRRSAGRAGTANLGRWSTRTAPRGGLIEGFSLSADCNPFPGERNAAWPVDNRARVRMIAR